MNTFNYRAIIRADLTLAQANGATAAIPPAFAELIICVACVWPRVEISSEATFTRTGKLPYSFHKYQSIDLTNARTQAHHILQKIR